MLPRRHILDICQTVKNDENILSMATMSLAIDAMKYMHKKPKKDHLVEALELNEFTCFMFPHQRPKNRALLYHIVADLLGLLMYGVPRTRKHVLENIETINYSEESMEAFPVGEVWNALKAKVYRKKHTADVIEGFIKKIAIEMDVVERYPRVEEIFNQSRKCITEWLPTLSAYYDDSKEKVRSSYEKWWELWQCNESKTDILRSMIDRLATQAETEFHIMIDAESIFTSLQSDTLKNKSENEYYMKHFREGMTLLLKI